MKNKLMECDKCHSKIIKNKCSCGTWYDSEDTPTDALILEAAMLTFNSYHQDIFSADHHCGCSVIFFRGNYEDCEAVKEFIRKRKGLK